MKSTTNAEQPRAAHAPAGLEGAGLVRPRSIADACRVLAEAIAANKRALPLAGGTDFVVDRHLMPVDRAQAVDLVVDLTGVAGFHDIARAGDRLRFAGGVTYWDLRQSEQVTRSLPMLEVMARDVGAVQIQTRGTLAGNIATASPAADGVAALLALEAELELASVRGTRSISLRDALVGYRKTALAPDELIAGISVRVPAAPSSARWRKVGTRLAQAISKVALASVVERDAKGVITHARFGMASVAAMTHALPSVTAYLEGKTADTVDAGALDASVEADIRPIDDVRSTGEYRLHVAKALVRNALST